MKIILLLLLLGFPPVCQSQPNSKPVIHYVGNMGVAIVQNDSVILIDALHDYYGVYYLPSDTAILSRIRTKQKPYRYLLAISASHIHGDHFDSALFMQISKDLPQTRFFMGRQFEPLLKGIPKNAIQYADDFKSFQVSPNVKISITRIEHVGGARHKGISDYRVEVIWGNYRFIHFGDAEISEQTFSGIGPGADLAIIPSWFINDDKAQQLLEKAGFKKYLVTHIDPSDKAPTVKKKAANFILFTRYGDTYTLR